MSKRQRILVGTVEIGRHLFDLSDGFRQLGHQVNSIVGWRNPAQPDLTYDLTTALPFQPPPDNLQNPFARYGRALGNRTYKWGRLARLLTAYDVYVFQFGGSLLPGNRDFPVLKRLGKKVISIFFGDDIRHWSAAEPVWRSFGLQLAPYYRAVEKANGSYLSEKLRTLRMAENYADAIFSNPLQSELAVRPYMHFYIAANLSLYKCHIPRRDVPVVVHAPSFRGVKGTEEILAACEKLKAEGVAFELRLLENRTNSEVIQQLTEADVVVDQLNLANYGMLGLEGMATGCAVAGGQHYGFIPLPPDRPLWHIDSNNVYTQLKQLLTDKNLRIQLAEAGRPFIEKHHNQKEVARRILQSIEPAENVKPDYHPGFFARDYQLPAGETIPDDLKNLTARIIRKWGLPEGVSPKEMVERGLLSEDAANNIEPVLRWKPDYLPKIVKV